MGYKHSFIIFILWFISISFIPSDTNTDITLLSSYPTIGSPDLIRKYMHSYIWPTDASEKVTSSFGEYRTAHFHAGIDISTNGTTGYKVFAVADGYVDRIRIQANGYGKMLFIKHADGLYSTYAHLQKFNDTIERIIYEEQLRQGTYQVNLKLDSSRLPVKQGEIIAYTGDTGFGPPHLHFELRDPFFHPINPLLGNSFSIDDRIAPIIRRMTIKPLNYYSTVDGRREAKHYSRFPRYKGILKIPQPIKVHGEIGIGIDVSDRADGSWSKNGIHRIELYLDDSLCYTMELNLVPYDLTNQIDIHYDLASIIDGYGRYQKLYIDKGNALTFYDPKNSGSGIINTERISEGIHNFKIVCYDIANNSTELQGTMIAYSKSELEFSYFDSTKIRISSENHIPFSKILLYGKRTYQSSWNLHTLDKDRFETHETEMVLPVNTKPYNVIKIIGITPAGSESEPLYRFINKPNGPVRKINTDISYLEEGVEFIVTTAGVFTEPPEIIIHEGNRPSKIAVKPADLSKYTGIYIPSFLYQGKRKVMINAEVNGQPISDYKEITLYIIPDDRNGSLTIPEYDIRISYDSAAVYKPIYFCINKESKNNSTSYITEPKDLLLNRGITVSVPVDFDENSEQLGLYHRSTGGWTLQSGNPKVNSKYVTAPISRMFGEIALFRDIQPPSIGRLKTRIYGKKLTASFRYYDNLSGVDPDAIKMYIDDILIIPEIDGEHRKVSYQSHERLGSGTHMLRIIIQDRMQNEYELSRRFAVR